MGVVDIIQWTCGLCGHHIQNDWVEQLICIKFVIKLEHSSTETVRMIQKATAVGNWLSVASSPQHTHSGITCLVQFWVKHQIIQVTQPPPLQPRFGTLWLLAFPKTKITFEREEISECLWNLGKYDRAADGNWENCVRSQGAYFEGDWGIIVLCIMLLYLLQ